VRVKQPQQLAPQIDALLTDGKKRTTMQAIVRQWIAGKGGTTNALLDILSPIFEANPL
jgi:membrane carboxypeptidase/penicillin-binding protein